MELSFFLKRINRLRESPYCLCMWSPALNFEKFTDFHENYYESFANGDHPHSCTFQFVNSLDEQYGGQANLRGGSSS